MSAQPLLTDNALSGPSVAIVVGPNAVQAEAEAEAEANRCIAESCVFFCTFLGVGAVASLIARFVYS
jgi:hypothetical protein